MTLGTVLPTRSALNRGDAHAAEIDRQKNKIASSLRGCDVRRVGGETRYYKGRNRYAVISLSMKIRWFEVRKDGDYSIPA
jgi:hypothetical protein